MINPEPPISLKILIRNNVFRFTLLCSLVLVTFLNGLAETTDAWMRVDSDQQGQTIWVGATTGSWEHDVIFYPSSGMLEADIGRDFAIGESNLLLPMVGLLHDPIAGKLNWFSPQLFWISNYGKHSSELWVFFYLRATKSLTDTHWILFEERYAITDNFSVGPQVEWFHDYTAKVDFGRYVGIGAKVPYGTKSTLDLSVSKNTQSRGTVARATFVTNFD